MTVIVQISDTHFGTEVREVVQAVQESIAELNPSIVILSGDITQRARLSQFKDAKRFLDGLPGEQKVVIPGNHDIPLYNVFARFLTPYANYEQVFGARENVWDNGKVAIIGYDATSPYRHTQGSLVGNKLMAETANMTRNFGQKELIIAVAHQPLVITKPEDADEVLVNAEETAKVFSENNVDLVLSGHVHYPLITTTISAFPGLKRHFILSGAGTAISHRIRPGAPNSFNAIIVEADEVTITKYEYDDKLKKFVPDVPKAFIRGQNGWQGRN